MTDKDWMTEVIGNNVISVFEGREATEEALRWLRERPRTFGELLAEDIDWLRWMAANIRDSDLLEKLSQDHDSDVRMWVACNPATPQPVLARLAGDPVVFVRRGVARNHNTPFRLVIPLNEDPDVQVRTLACEDRIIYR